MRLLPTSLASLALCFPVAAQIAVPPQMPGFPIILGDHIGASPMGGANLVDLDRDGDLEIVVTNAHWIHAVHHDAVRVQGFPVQLDWIAQEAPGVGDLDGDGDIEIVQVTRGVWTSGNLVAVDHRGNMLPGFPVSFGGNMPSGSPTLADLDDDGQLEILVQERDEPNGWLHVFEADGTEWGGNWPFFLNAVPGNTPAVGDVDADGEPEIVVASFKSLYVLEIDGSLLPGWPKTQSGTQWNRGAPALADLDDDGDLEIAIAATGGNSGLYVYHHDATDVDGFPFHTNYASNTPPTISDLDGDGTKELIVGHDGIGGAGVTFWVLGSDGEIKNGFPFKAPQGSGTYSPFTTTDLDGDGVLEILLGHLHIQAGKGYIHAVRFDGTEFPGFPLRPKHWTAQNGATLGDLDGDGDIEYVVVSAHLLDAELRVYDSNRTFRPSPRDWHVYHKDLRRGGDEALGEKLFLAGKARVGMPLKMTVTGMPGDLASLWASATLDPMDTPWGWFSLGQRYCATILDNVPLPSSGRRSVDFTIPNDCALVGENLHFQGIVAGQSESVITELKTIVVRP